MLAGEGALVPKVFVAETVATMRSPCARLVKPAPYNDASGTSQYVLALIVGSEPSQSVVSSRKVA